MKRLMMMVAACLVLAIGTTGFAAEKLVFGAVKNTPPFLFEENGEIKGIAVDIFKEIQKRAGFEAEIQPLPARRMVKWGMIGKNDGMLQIYYAKAREDRIIYSAIPGYESKHSVFVKKGNKGKFTGSKLEDLYGKKVAWNKGYRMSDAMAKAVKDGKFILDGAKETDLNIKKLLKGRIDCYINSHDVTMYYLKKMGLQGQLVALPDPFTAKKGTFMALSRQGTRVKNKEAFMAKFNAALKSIYKDGTAQKIINSYTQ